LEQISWSTAQVAESAKKINKEKKMDTKQALENHYFELDNNKNIASSFVKKLFEMVENESDDIIVWVANGTAFEVKDPKRLEIEILPNFFRHCRFQSLVRQLNFYAFKVCFLTLRLSSLVVLISFFFLFIEN
jgi:hypothetical protein